jgi:hypothetical protein
VTEALLRGADAACVAQQLTALRVIDIVETAAA